MTTEKGIQENQTFEGRSLTRSAETAMTAAAATAKSMVESRYIVALNRPRNFDAARIRLLETCKRPRFAAMARYKKPVAGTFIEGPSIRFADEAVKILGNIDTRQEVIFEDEEQRVVQITVTDLESNLTKADTATVKKVVERKKPKEGQIIVGRRENSRGEMVFLIKAGDDEINIKEANLCAKKRRNLELQLIPQDLIEECEDEVIGTLQRKDKDDPDASRKAILDGFAAIGIMPEQIEEYLGHSTQKLTPAEFQALRGIGAAIRDEQTTWVEVIESKSGRKPKADRATVDLDDITPGDPATHTPVDEPAEPNSNRTSKTSGSNDGFKAALRKLNRLAVTNEAEVNEKLQASGVGTLDEIPADATNPTVMKAVIAVAADFKE